jgi:hypothetical protein
MEANYEFEFPSSNFDQQIYDECFIPDVIGDRQALIETAVGEIKGILENPALNLHKFSTFVQHDDKNYKVTVTNPNWGI